MENLPERKSQRNTCFARRHMKSGPFALYDYAYKLSHGKKKETGVFWSNARGHARELGVSKTTLLEWLHLLTAEGWLVCLDDPRRRRATGQTMPVRYMVRDHDEWSELYPGKCFFAEAAPKTWRPKTKTLPVPESGPGPGQESGPGLNQKSTSAWTRFPVSPGQETGPKTVLKQDSINTRRSLSSHSLEPQSARSEAARSNPPNPNPEDAKLQAADAELIAKTVDYIQTRIRSGRKILDRSVRDFAASLRWYFKLDVGTLPPEQIATEAMKQFPSWHFSTCAEGMAERHWTDAQLESEVKAIETELLKPHADKPALLARKRTLQARLRHRRYNARQHMQW